jgi:PknH-like protein
VAPLFSMPPGPPGQIRGSFLRRQRPLWLVIIGAAAVVLVGTLTFLLWPTAPPHEASLNSPLHVVPGTVQADILTPDEVSTAVGITLISQATVDQPPPALAAEPASCAVAVGPATATAYTTGWTVFLSSTYQDSAGVGDYTVTQSIGVYGDAGKASDVLKTLGDGVKGCPSATRTGADKSSVKWNYSVDSAASGSLAWSASQDSGGGWACYRQARLKGKDVIEVAVCEGGDGKSAAARIADQVVANVGG